MPRPIQLAPEYAMKKIVGLSIALASVVSTGALASNPAPTVVTSSISADCDQDETEVSWEQDGLHIEFGSDFEAFAAQANQRVNKKCKVQFEVTPPSGYYLEFNTLETEYQYNLRD